MNKRSIKKGPEKKLRAYTQSRSPESSVDKVPDLVEATDGLVSERVVVVATRSDLVQATSVLSGKLADLKSLFVLLDKEKKTE
jgi:hypothetical protein